MIVNMCDKNVLGSRLGLMEPIATVDFCDNAVAVELKAKKEKAERWIKRIRTQFAASERECQNVCINV